MGSDDKLTKLQGDYREQVLQYVRRRWEQLANADRDARQQAAKFIAVINAGGAAGVLAYIGAIVKDKTELASSSSLKWTLCSFVVGVLFSALAHTVASLRLNGLFTHWRRDVAQFYEDKIGFDTLRLGDVKRAEESDSAEFCVWMALLCFVIGAVAGLYSLMY